MPSTLRMKRINDRMKEILSIALVSKVEDPRLEGVSVTDVSVDRELDFANIYVSALGGEARAREVIEALNHARGFLKYEISQEIDLRLMPKLRFFWDPTPEKADRIDNLIAQIKAEEAHVEEYAEESDQDDAEEDDLFYAIDASDFEDDLDFDAEFDPDTFDEEVLDE